MAFQPTTLFMMQPTMTFLLEILESANVRIIMQLGQDNWQVPRSEIETHIRMMLLDSQRSTSAFIFKVTLYSELEPWKASVPAKTKPVGCKKGKKNKSVAGNRNTQDHDQPITSSSVNTLTDAFSAFQFIDHASNPDRVSCPVEEQAGKRILTNLGRSLLEMARFLDTSLSINKFIRFQDKDQTSSIILVVVSIRKCLLDEEIPMIFVLFHHVTKSDYTIRFSKDLEASLPQILSTFQPEVAHGSASFEVKEIEAGLNEQQVFLRQLLYNSRKFPIGYDFAVADLRKGALHRFRPSFILPFHPISPPASLFMTNAIDEVATRCDAQECTGILFHADPKVCARCGFARYCSETCQDDNFAAHSKCCDSIVNSRVISFECMQTSSHEMKFITLQILSDGITWAPLSFSDLRPENASDTLARGLALSREMRPCKIIFIVKVQNIPEIPGPLMIYDEEKIFVISLPSPGPEVASLILKDPANVSQDEYASEWLSEFADSREGKGYVYARHSEDPEGETRLEVLMDVFPPQDLPW